VGSSIQVFQGENPVLSIPAQSFFSSSIWQPFPTGARVMVDAWDDLDPVVRVGPPVPTHPGRHEQPETDRSWCPAHPRWPAPGSEPARITSDWRPFKFKKWDRSRNQAASDANRMGHVDPTPARPVHPGSCRSAGSPCTVSRSAPRLVRQADLHFTGRLIRNPHSSPVRPSGKQIRHCLTCSHSFDKS